MFTLESTVQEKIFNDCTSGKCKSHCNEFTVSAVISAVKLLKNGRKDGHESLYLEEIIHCPNLIFVYLSILFTAIYVMATFQMACY